MNTKSGPSDNVLFSGDLLTKLSPAKNILIAPSFPRSLSSPPAHLHSLSDASILVDDGSLNHRVGPNANGDASTGKH